MEEGPARESTEETEEPEDFPEEAEVEVGPRKPERCLVQVGPERMALQLSPQPFDELHHIPSRGGRMR